jgi:hypothetical protein
MGSDPFSLLHNSKEPPTLPSCCVAEIPTQKGKQPPNLGKTPVTAVRTELAMAAPWLDVLACAFRD